MPHEWLKQASPSARLKIRIKYHHDRMLKLHEEINEPQPILFKGPGHPAPKRPTLMQRLQALLP